MTQLKTVKLYPMHEGVEAPSLGSSLASGYDLKVWGDHNILPGETKILPTGLKLADVLPPGVDMQVRPRSSTPLKYGLLVANSPGTIDGDYTGEIGIIVHRLFTFWDLQPQFIQVAEYPSGLKAAALTGIDPSPVLRIDHGTRLAQLVFSQLIQPRPFIELTTMNETREERGGFGSTGT